MESASLDPVIEFFEAADLKYSLLDGGENGRAVRSRFACSSGDFDLIIFDCCGAIVFTIPGYLTVRPAHREAVLARASAINYETALGRFAVDPRDGEMRVDLTFPPQPSRIRPEQVALGMSVLLGLAELHIDELTLLNLSGEGARPAPPPDPLARLGYGAE